MSQNEECTTSISQNTFFVTKVHIIKRSLFLESKMMLCKIVFHAVPGNCSVGTSVKAKTLAFLNSHLMHSHFLRYFLVCELTC